MVDFLRLQFSVTLSPNLKSGLVKAHATSRIIAKKSVATFPTACTQNWPAFRFHQFCSMAFIFVHASPGMMLAVSNG